MSVVVATTTINATATLGAWISAVKAAGAGINPRRRHGIPPILSGVRITARDGVVTATGFDFEVTAVSEVIGGSYGSDGSVLVNHKMLLDMLTTAGKRATKRVSDAWNVSIAAEGNMVKVSINGTSFTLSQFPLADYPEVPTFESETAIRLDPALFIRRMDSALVSVSTDDTLPILTGVKLEVSGSTMALLSTDRYRLTMGEMPIERVLTGSEHDYLGEYNVLLSGKTWKNFKRSIDAKGGALEMRFHEAGRYSGYRVSFHQGALSLGTLTLEGDYPKIRSLFPDSAPIAFEMDADLLASLVAQVSVTAERNTPVRFTYNGIDSLRVDAGTGEDAQAQAFMPYSSPYGNRGFSVAFNPAYLLEALKDMKGLTIQFLHTTAPKPAAVVAPELPEVQHLIMPVRLP